jgi:hypothetical protein
MNEKDEENEELEKYTFLEVREDEESNAVPCVYEHMDPIKFHLRATATMAWDSIPPSFSLLQHHAFATMPPRWLFIHRDFLFFRNFFDWRVCSSHSTEVEFLWIYIFLLCQLGVFQF